MPKEATQRDFIFTNKLGFAIVSSFRVIYDVSIPVGRSAHKKIAYINQWDRNRTFSLRTSHPNIMKCKEPQLSVRMFGKAFIRLWFAPISVPGIREFFVFVNDESDQNEECLLIKVQFS